jgi:predicted aldo/keto reductase-like oxidoreductase
VVGRSWCAMGRSANLSRAIGTSRACLPLPLSVPLPSNVVLISGPYKIPDAEQVQLLMEICNTVPDDASKVKCIGILECVAVHPSSVEANKVLPLIELSIPE